MGLTLVARKIAVFPLGLALALAAALSLGTARTAEAVVSPQVAPAVVSTQIALPAKASTSKKPYLAQRCRTGKLVLCANKATHKLYVVENGKITTTLSVRFGRPGYSTRSGTFHVFRKVKNDWSHVYHVRMRYSMYFSGGQAVHYSVDFATHGYGVGSHGCINTRDLAKTKKLFAKVPKGTKVVVFRH